MYTLTKAAALEFTEKNKFQLKGRYKSEGGDGINIGAFNIPRGLLELQQEEEFFGRIGLYSKL